MVDGLCHEIYGRITSVFYPMPGRVAMFPDISVVISNNSPKGNRDIIQHIETNSPFKSCRFCQTMLKVLRG